MNKKDLPPMYSTAFWCLFVVLRRGTSGFRQAQMARFNGEIMDLFSSRSPREEEEVSLLGRS